MQEIQYLCGHAVLYNSRERSVYSMCSCKAICSFTFTVTQAAARGVRRAGVNEIKATPVQCVEVDKKNIYKPYFTASVDVICQSVLDATF